MSTIDDTNPQAGQLVASSVIRTLASAAKTDIQALEGGSAGFPYISQAVHTSNNQLTFGDTGVDNTSRLQAIIDGAYASGKFLIMDHSGAGGLHHLGAINWKVSVYGEGKPEVWNGAWQGGYWRPALSRDLVMSGVVFRKLKGVANRVVSLDRDAAGAATIVLADAHHWLQNEAVTGVWMAGRDTGTYTFFDKLISSVVSDHSIIVATGVSGAAGTWDGTRSVSITAASRVDGRLKFTCSGHTIQPGQFVSVVGIINSSLNVQKTLNLSAGSQNISIADTSGIAIGDHITEPGGRFAPDTIVQIITTNTNLYITKPIVSAGSSITVNFEKRSMEVQKTRVVRTSATEVYVDDVGAPDDTAVSVSATLTTDEDWGRIRGSRNNASMGLGTDSGFIFAHYDYLPGLLFEDVECHGAGFMMASPGDFTLRRVLVKGTTVDLFHVRAPSIGRALIEQCSAIDGGDDGFPIVSYGHIGHTISEMVYDGNYADRAGRAFMLAGAHKVRLRHNRAENCKAGLFIEQGGSFNVLRSRDINVINHEIRCCGGETEGYGSITIQGGEDVEVVNAKILDSVKTGILLLYGSDLKFRDTQILGAYAAYGVQVGEPTSGATANSVDVHFDGLSIKESYADSIYVYSNTQGNLRFMDVELEDIASGETGSASGFDFNDLGAGCKVDIDGLLWNKQKYGNLQNMIFSPSGGSPGNIRVRGDMVTPGWLYQGLLEVDYGLASPNEEVVGRIYGTVSWSNNADVPFVMGELGRQGFIPKRLLIYYIVNNGIPANPTNLEIWSGKGRTGVKMFGAGNALRVADDDGLKFTRVPIGGSIFKITGTTTSSSTTVQFDWQHRMDRVMVGHDVTGTGISAGTYVAAVDRKLQTVTLSAVATASGTVVLTFSPMPVQAVTARSAWMSVQGGAITNLATGTDMQLILLGEKVSNPLVRKWYPVAYATPLALDLSLGLEQEIAALSGALTMDPPTGGYGPGDIVELNFLQNGTGGFAITWNAVWHGATLTASGTANQRATVRFIVDPVGTLMQLDSTGWYTV